MKVQVVHPDVIQQTWELVKPFLITSLESDVDPDGETIEQQKVFLTQGFWQLLAFVDDFNEIHGVIVVKYLNNPNSRVAYVKAFAGRLVTDKDVRQQLFQILRDNGATTLQAGCRDSVMRLVRVKFNAVKRCNIMEVKL